MDYGFNKKKQNFKEILIGRIKMKIAYIMPVGTSLTGKADGVRMQALIWREALVKRGHQVDLIEAWGEYDWASYDAIHLFSQGCWLFMIEELSGKNPKVVVSPIIDTNVPRWKYRLASYWGCHRLRIESQNYVMRRQSQFTSRFLARSQYEKDYIKCCTYMDDAHIDIVPLSYRLEATAERVPKEKFCFHISQFTSDRKNVMRLMEAAVKYGFQLVVAGSRGSAEAFAPFKEMADKHDNITILGYLTDEELESYYNRAKVFALPSLFEGVGLVALEAAMHHCDIVLTNLGGPKEYYGGHAHLVNPYSVDEIGRAVTEALNAEENVALYDFVKANSSLDHCVELLEECYKRL